MWYFRGSLVHSGGVRFDLDESRAFLAEWDAHRANRADVARRWGFERSYAYDVAARCREKVAEAEAAKENGPVPAM